MVKRWIILGSLALVIAVPFLLRPSAKSVGTADEVLVVITPHNEAIRHEFGLAFASWFEEQTGRTVAIDWRVIGGTSEIARFLAGEYTAAFRYHWENNLSNRWDFSVQSAFLDGRLPEDASAAEKEARTAFLESNVSCGIDLFFGGGPYDFIRQARMGTLVPSRVFEKYPDWFSEDVIPYSYAGETYWDEDHRWVGTVLSSYGMIYNRDVLELRDIAEPPASWRDLGNPKLIGSVALTDPTKSGSIAKAFENVIQQQMQAALADYPTDEDKAVSEGWMRGLQLLQLAAANSRYFTDSSQKPPIDVASGNCAIGMCIDFYGRQQEEAVRRRGDSIRVGYVSPPGGSVSSVDPIGILRGAPNYEVAELFVEFVMSLEGQKIWNFAPGTPGGPQHFALRRLPVRRDFYEQPWSEFRSDPNDEPYAAGEQLIYRAEWTSYLFREMSFIIRVMGFDAHPELQAAWQEIIDAGMPQEAIDVLQDMSVVNYELARTEVRDIIQSRNKTLELELAKELGNHFRKQYGRAAQIARDSRVN